MIKVNVKKVSDNVIAWTGTFDTESEALSWVSLHSEKGTWGKDERWVRADMNDVVMGEDKAQSDQVRSVDVGIMSLNEYHFKADYIVYLVDLGDSPKLERVRDQRNARLTQCDWTQLPDSPLSSEKKQEWAEYRQALRDLPQMENLNVNNPQWPAKPN